MPKADLLENTVVRFIKDNPHQYTTLHEAACRIIKGRPWQEQMEVIRPLALGRLSAMRAGHKTKPYVQPSV